MPGLFDNVITLGEAISIGLAGLVGIFGGYKWLRHQYGAFEVRFLDPDDEPVRAEGMRRSITARIPIGKSVVRFHIRPRRFGIDLRSLNFAFFDNAIYPTRFLPRSHGRRREITEIKVSSLKTLDPDGQWKLLAVLPRDQHAMTFATPHELFPGNRRVYELEFDVADVMQGWDGILGFQLQYQPGLSLDRRDIHAKAFVGCRRRPLTFCFRRLQRAKPVEKLTYDTPNSQPLEAGQGRP